MKDFLGNELNPGDLVIFNYSASGGKHCLLKGKIERIERGLAYIADCSTSDYAVRGNPFDPANRHIEDGKWYNQSSVRSQNIYKL